MRKFVIAASAAALLAGSSLAALADEVTGAITSIDMTAATVTLDDGTTYKLPESVDAASLAVGDQVTIEVEEASDGSMEIQSLEKSAM